jgi:hypothetical protein
MGTRRFLSLVFALMFLGCGGEVEDRWTANRETVVPVTGHVLLDDAPLEGATVNFYSETEDLTAYGLTDANGRFRLTTYEANDGAVPGKHRVTVRKVIVNTVLNPEDPEGEPLSTSEEWIVPERYSDKETSGLSAGVTEEGDNDFTFELKK